MATVHGVAKESDMTERSIQSIFTALKIVSTWFFSPHHTPLATTDLFTVSIVLPF